MRRKNQVIEGIVSESGKQSGQGNWENYDSSKRNAYANLANATAMIIFNENGSHWKPLCTGFLFNQTSLLTAGHCDQQRVSRKDYDEYGAERYKFVFNYQESSDGSPYGVKEIKGIYPCDNTQEQYDYAIFKLKSSAKKFGTLQLQDEYRNGQNIVVAHHPEGKPKKISLGNLSKECARHGLFAHTADTLGGSSGAPVATMGQKVIGIHVQGGEKENYAVPI